MPIVVDDWRTTRTLSWNAVAVGVVLVSHASRSPRSSGSDGNGSDTGGIYPLLTLFSSGDVLFFFLSLVLL